MSVFPPAFAETLLTEPSFQPHKCLAQWMVMSVKATEVKGYLHCSFSLQLNSLLFAYVNDLTSFLSLVILLLDSLMMSYMYIIHSGYTHPYTISDPPPSRFPISPNPHSTFTSCFVFVFALLPTGINQGYQNGHGLKTTHCIVSNSPMPTSLKTRPPLAPLSQEELHKPFPHLWLNQLSLTGPMQGRQPQLL